MSNLLKGLKAFVKYDGTGRIVPSSLILQRNKPEVGDWEEIKAHKCCNPTTTVAPIPFMLCLGITEIDTPNPTQYYTMYFSGYNVTGRSNYSSLNITDGEPTYIIQFNSSLNIWEILKYDIEEEGYILFEDSYCTPFNVLDTAIGFPNCWGGYDDRYQISISGQPCNA